MAIDFDAPAAKVKSPNKLAHVVLRTNNFKTMVAFYQEFLGARVVHENDFVAFLTYDEEHHRIAIAAIPGIQAKNKMTCGLEHMAFTFDSLTDLLVAYRQRKARGILPLWPVNHGPTTSIYYHDPDGNVIETQAENFDDPAKAAAYLTTEEFGANPIGVDFDPEDYIKRLSNGESEADVKKRPASGPRGVPDFL